MNKEKVSVYTINGVKKTHQWKYEVPYTDEECFPWIVYRVVNRHTNKCIDTFNVHLDVHDTVTSSIKQRSLVFIEKRYILEYELHVHCPDGSVEKIDINEDQNAY
jgi:hypothetical protein